MGLLETVAAYFGKKIADEFYVKLRAEISAHFSEEVQTVQESIDKIERGMNAVMLEPIRAGVGHWRIQEFESARDKFIQAVSLEEEAPLPKVLLGKCLIHLVDIGRVRSRQAESYLREAGDYLQRAFEADPFLFASTLPTLFRFPDHELDEGFKLELPDRQLSHLVHTDGFFGPHGACVQGISAATDGLICDLLLSEKMNKSHVRVIGRFDVRAQTWTWANRSEKWRLVWATNKHIALSNGDPKRGFKLIDAQTGKELREANGSYLTTLFYGGHLKDVSGIGKIICRVLPTPEEAMQRSSTETMSAVDRVRWDLRQGPRHGVNVSAGKLTRAWMPNLGNLLNRDETLQFQDVCKLPIYGKNNRWTATVINEWTHRHEKTTVINLECKLKCSSRIVFTATEVTV